MIVITENDAETRTWKDPLLEIHVDEFRKCALGLDAILAKVKPDCPHSKEIEDLAEFLCEMSRDLIYRANRVTKDQVQGIIKVFSCCVERFEQADVTKSLSYDAKQYLTHIRSRIDMLRDRLK